MKRSDLEHILRASKGVTGETEFVWCLEPHDLAFSKLVARREKDLAFVAALLRFKMVRASRLHNLIRAVEDRAVREPLTEALAICQRR